VRLAKDLQCLEVQSNGLAAKTDEIGKLVGGWRIRGCEAVRHQGGWQTVRDRRPFNAVPNGS
jgi:hypothetical protein